jgi:hypothetical protein
VGCWFQIAIYLAINGGRSSAGGWWTSDVDRPAEAADLSGVSGTPIFFINGRRHYGACDINTLSAAVRAARLRAAGTTPSRPPQPWAARYDIHVVAAGSELHRLPPGIAD